MNGRIKELAAKSNFGHIENNDVVFDHRLEKFAELIIKECAKIDLEELSFTAYAKLYKRYQEHFGIEE
jgi:hypothetical protein